MSKKKRNIIIAVIVAIGIIIIGICNMPSATPKASEFGGISTDIKQYPEIINGKNVGTYAIADYDAKTTTNEQIINYYNAKIKNRKDNYFILLDGTESVLFPGCFNIGLSKGQYDSNTKTIGNVNFNGEINNNILTWTKANKQN